ncbi:MAG: acyl carrier protein [Verrucomicrobiota bacterium]
MSDNALAVALFLGLVFGLLILPMALSAVWYRFHPRKPRGVHFSPAAATWAETRFLPKLRSTAAFVGDLLRDQLGVGFEQLEPQTRFIEDLDMTDLEPVEVLMALEEDLGIEIPHEDVEHLSTIAELVHYLDGRLHVSDKITQPSDRAN